MVVGPVIHFIIVNINGLAYTKSVVQDLMTQTSPFLATIYDQASTEPGTSEFLSSLEPPFEFVQNTTNVGLNRLWNRHYETTTAPYLCFLNNDVRIPSNFVADTVAVLDAEPKVGCVIHSTNHPDYQVCGPLEYIIMHGPLIQGWDFTMRREAYYRIPDDLITFGGDDYLFAKLHKHRWKVAVVLSSPIIHYYARSRRYYDGDRQAEAQTYQKYGFRRLFMCPYSRRFPL